MTYKEVLQESLETFKTEKLEFDSANGEHIVQEPIDCLPVAFGTFLRGMAAILVGVTDGLLKMEVGDIYVGDKKIESGKIIDNPTRIDYESVLNGHSISRGVMLSTQVQGFIEWLLKQKAECDDLESLWCYASTLGGKWNEYAFQKMSGGE